MSEVPVLCPNCHDSFVTRVLRHREGISNKNRVITRTCPVCSQAVSFRVQYALEAHVELPTDPVDFDPENLS